MTQPSRSRGAGSPSSLELGKITSIITYMAGMKDEIYRDDEVSRFPTSAIISLEGFKVEYQTQFRAFLRSRHLQNGGPIKSIQNAKGGESVEFE